MLLALAALMLNAGVAQAASAIVVDSTGDADARDGVITLSEAILLATGVLAAGDLDAGEADNVSGAPGAASADTITFDAAVFPVAAPATILIDRWDPAYGVGLPPLSTGNDTVDGSGMGVVVDGGSDDPFGPFITCLTVSSSSNVIRGLEITGCTVGVDVNGDFNTIGGSGPGEENVISANSTGVTIFGGNFNTVVGNKIGTDPTGTAPMSTRTGILMGFARNNTIGPGNLISGNTGAGVYIRDRDHNIPPESSLTTDNRVIGNLIGTDVSGTLPLPNGTGVAVGKGAYRNAIGGTGSGEANVIAFNTYTGVSVGEFFPDDSIGITIRGNSIYSNGWLGIETLLVLAAPVITSVSATVDGTACPICTIDVYSDDQDEGRLHEGSTTADGTGNWSFSGAVVGPYVTATATDAIGSTSEFSAPALVDDTDGDGWPGWLEFFVGTDPNLACPATAASNDEDPDAWPPDFNDSRNVNLVDLVGIPGFKTSFGATDPDPNYIPRFDLSADGAINLVDLVGAPGFKSAFGTTCTP
jgi:hypothetical protein